MTIYTCNECRLLFEFRSLLHAHQIETGHEGITIENGVRMAPMEPIDRMFREAAAAGFEPVTDEQAEAMRQKLRGVSARIHGGRR